MSQTALVARYKQLILGHLRHPLKLRFLLCVTIVAGWYFLFYSPLSKQMAATTSGISSEQEAWHRARVRAAQEGAGTVSETDTQGGRRQ